MLDLYSIPADWRDTLYRIQQKFPGAMIAGGALRDLDNSRKVKDIDIFVPNTSSYAVAKAGMDEMGHCTSAIANGGPDASYTGWAADDVVGIFSLADELWDYQIIFLKGPPGTILDRIDFGICRIGYDGKRILRALEYLKDRQDGTFTLHRCEDTGQYDRSIRRWDRLSKKYEGWTMEIAPHLQSSCGSCPCFEGCFCRIPE